MITAEKPGQGTTRELLDLALPMVISNGSYAVMVFCDRLFMSLLGPEYMSASMGGGVAAFFSMSLFIGVMAYANAMVAQYYGAGSLHKCPRVVTQGIIMATLCLPLLALITWYIHGLFGDFGHAPRQVELERVYYLVLMLGCFFNLSKTCLASYFSGIARTRVVMIADVFGMLLNIPLSYALIFGKLGLPELGIAGAAWGTVIATAFSLLVFALFYFSHTHRQRFSVMDSLHFDSGILRRFIRLGFPSGFELFMNVATFNLFILLFQSYGVAHGAAAAIVFNWDMVSFVPMIGLNIAVISLIGRYVGADDLSRADGVIAAAYRVALLYSSMLAVVFVVFRIELIDVFSRSGADFTEIREIGGFMMVGLACYVMADASILISGGALRGAGDTRWLMLTSITLHWLMLLSQYLIIVVYEYGPRISWVALVVMIILIAVAYLGRLYGGVWREPERLARVMQE